VLRSGYELNKLIPYSEFASSSFSSSKQINHNDDAIADDAQIGRGQDQDVDVDDEDSWELSVILEEYVKQPRPREQLGSSSSTSSSESSSSSSVKLNRDQSSDDHMPSSSSSSLGMISSIRLHDELVNQERVSAAQALREGKFVHSSCSKLIFRFGFPNALLTNLVVFRFSQRSASRFESISSCRISALVSSTTR
jgi:hypothetical protein